MEYKKGTTNKIYNVDRHVWSWGSRVGDENDDPTSLSPAHRNVLSSIRKNSIALYKKMVLHYINDRVTLFYYAT